MNGVDDGAQVLLDLDGRIGIVAVDAGDVARVVRHLASTTGASSAPTMPKATQGLMDRAESRPLRRHVQWLGMVANMRRQSWTYSTAGRYLRLRELEPMGCGDHHRQVILANDIPLPQLDQRRQRDACKARAGAQSQKQHSAGECHRHGLCGRCPQISHMFAMCLQIVDAASPQAKPQ